MNEFEEVKKALAKWTKSLSNAIRTGEEPGFINLEISSKGVECACDQLTNELMVMLELLDEIEMDYTNIKQSNIA